MTDVLLLVLARPSRLRHNFTAARTNFYTQRHTAPRDPSAHSIDQITGVYVIVMRFQGTWYRGTRERNLLALPTLDMYLPLSKFESIQRVSIDATV